MAPVTLAFGPSASYNLLSILCPGLLCYLMYRAARLWLRTQFGAIAAGAFFGLSPVLAWRSWYELNLALGALFLPLALEAAVRLRRRGRARAAVALGAVLGAALLTDQESAVLAAIVAGPGPAAVLPAPTRLGSACAGWRVAALTAAGRGQPADRGDDPAGHGRPDPGRPVHAAGHELRVLRRGPAAAVRAVAAGGRVRAHRGQPVSTTRARTAWPWSRSARC